MGERPLEGELAEALHQFLQELLQPREISGFRPQRGLVHIEIAIELDLHGVNPVVGAAVVRGGEPPAIGVVVAHR